MRKAVFIVEGQTEQVFVLNFLLQLCAIQALHVDLYKLHKGLVKVSWRGCPADLATHSIHIVNVENDEKVLSYIQENLDSFKRSGFSSVFGLRDRYSGDSQKKPVNPLLIDGLTERLSNDYGLDIQVTVALEEIEAWFLAVPDFFLKYDLRLTEDAIAEQLGYRLSEVDVESLAHPSSLINKLLMTVGKRYRKRLDDSHKIADALDYQSLYLDKSESINALGRFVKQMNLALV